MGRTWLEPSVGLLPHLGDVIRIEGHASKAGSEELNYDFAENRANAISEYIQIMLRPLEDFIPRSPDYVVSTGESGSYRTQFGHIPMIDKSPEPGHPNDPVEKAVLLSFDTGDVDVTVEPFTENSWCARTI